VTLSGASRDYINLLPDPAGDDSWTTFLPTVEDIGDDAIFAFDGETTAVEIPRSALDPDLLSTAARFTISTWMKRDQRQAEEHDKQQIVCAADGEGSTQAAAYTSSSQLTLSSRTKQGCSISLQSGRILRGPRVARQQQLSVNICCRRPISAANPWVAAAADNRRDRQTHGRTLDRFDSYRILGGPH